MVILCRGSYPVSSNSNFTWESYPVRFDGISCRLSYVLRFEHGNFIWDSYPVEFDAKFFVGGVIQYSLIVSSCRIVIKFVLMVISYRGCYPFSCDGNFM